MSEEDPYTYPGSSVLRNKLGITRAERFNRIERQLVAQRAEYELMAEAIRLTMVSRSKTVGLSGTSYMKMS